MRGNIRIGDIGTVFRLTVKDQDEVVVDVSTASTKQIIFTDPSGTTTAKTATFTTDGTDGKIQYQTVANDLDEAGQWQIQGYVVISSGSWKTNILRFDVLANL